MLLSIALIKIVFIFMDSNTVQIALGHIQQKKKLRERILYRKTTITGKFN